VVEAGGAQNGVDEEDDDEEEEEEEEEDEADGLAQEAGGAATRRQDNWGQCVVCLNRRKRVVFAPCGHRACCAACARQVCGPREPLPAPLPRRRHQSSPIQPAKRCLVCPQTRTHDIL